MYNFIYSLYNKIQETKVKEMHEQSLKQGIQKIIKENEMLSYFIIGFARDSEILFPKKWGRGKIFSWKNSRLYFLYA